MRLDAMARAVLACIFVSDGTRIEVARGNQLLNRLPDALLQPLLAGASVTQFAFGRRLYRDEGSVDTVYFPASGVVSIVVDGPRAGTVEMATIGNEGLVGVPVSLGVPRSLGRTEVQIPGAAVTIPGRRFEELMREQPTLQLLVHRYVYYFLRLVMQAGACNRLHTSEERCARWLLMTHDRVGSNCFPLTQEFLAEMLGTGRAQVNAALSLFRETGAVQYVYREITIVDRVQLESFACPCYGLIRRTYELVKL